MKGTNLPPLILLFLFTACIPNKKVLYLQDHIGGENSINTYSPDYPEYTLQIGDIINVDVKSNTPQLVAIFLSKNSSNASGQLANNAADINFLDGYQVNKNGTVELPLIGDISVEGKSIVVVKEEIESEIRKYVSDAFVQVRLGGLRYAALGEFNRPGRYAILQSQVTIFEAIANAGDLTVLANRKKAIIIRQTGSNSEIHEIDLTDRLIIDSEFYYLKPNDQIYIEPLSVRQLGAGVGVTGFQTFTALLSAVSSALLIIVSLNRL